MEKRGYSVYINGLSKRQFHFFSSFFFFNISSSRFYFVDEYCFRLVLFFFFFSTCDYEREFWFSNERFKLLIGFLISIFFFCFRDFSNWRVSLALIELILCALRRFFFFFFFIFRNMLARWWKCLKAFEMWKRIYKFHVTLYGIIRNESNLRSLRKVFREKLIDFNSNKFGIV